jgi:hypothetical protein
MDLGVLEEMDGIRNKVQVKLQRQQEGFLEQLLASYSGLVYIYVLPLHDLFQISETQFQSWQNCQT